MSDAIVAEKKTRKRPSRAGDAYSIEYNKRYAAENAEKLRAYRVERYHSTKDEKREANNEAKRLYNERHKAAISERRKRKLLVDPKLREKNNQRARDWYVANKAAVLEKLKRTYNADSENVKKRVAAYRVANPEKVREVHRVVANRRRARLIDVGGGQYTKHDVRALLVLQKNKCANCKCSIKDGYHIDHREPVALGGTNDKTNIELLCPPCNLKKGAKPPHVFAKEQGRLI